MKFIIKLLCQKGGFVGSTGNAHTFKKKVTSDDEAYSSLKLEYEKGKNKGKNKEENKEK